MLSAHPTHTHLPSGGSPSLDLAHLEQARVDAALGHVLAPVLAQAVGGRAQVVPGDLAHHMVGHVHVDVKAQELNPLERRGRAQVWRQGLVWCVGVGGASERAGRGWDSWVGAPWQEASQQVSKQAGTCSTAWDVTAATRAPPEPPGHPSCPSNAPAGSRSARCPTAAPWLRSTRWPA